LRKKVDLALARTDALPMIGSSSLRSMRQYIASRTKIQQPGSDLVRLHGEIAKQPSSLKETDI